eukprot:GHRQ01040056.1.p1 GENE.GHRQ01040056.1~~GHRQ01040056.1.p1  ORF type:complete len:147 (-),score=44.72 GHRQ01040056.1:135-575(-)
MVLHGRTSHAGFGAPWYAHVFRCCVLVSPAGMNDAIRTGTGLLHGIPVALAVMEFGFMGGSMGSVVGEKLTRLIEYATQQGLTLLVVCTSGGARMQVRLEQLAVHWTTDWRGRGELHVAVVARSSTICGLLLAGSRELVVPVADSI